MIDKLPTMADASIEAKEVFAGIITALGRLVSKSFITCLKDEDLLGELKRRGYTDITVSLLDNGTPKTFNSIGKIVE